MFLQGRANLNDNAFRNLSKYAWLNQSDVFTGEIEQAVYSDYIDKNGAMGSKINVTVCNDQTMQKAGFTIFVFRKGSQTFTGHVSQIMYHTGIDIDNCNGLDMVEMKNKNGDVVKNSKTDTPIYLIPCLRGTAITVMLKKTGEGRDRDNNPMPFLELFGWEIFNAQGFSANECKYGDCIIEKTYGRGFKFAEVYEKFMDELKQNQQNRYGNQQPAQQQPQQAQGYNQPQNTQMQTNYAPQYGAQPNAQSYRNLPPLPGRPQNMPQQQPTQQQVQQADNGNEPLPF